MTVTSRHVGGRGRPQDVSTWGERTQSFPCIIRRETVTFRLQKYRNGGQLWVVNVFSYTIHAQTDSSPSCFPLAPFLFFSFYCDVSEARSYFASTIQQATEADWLTRARDLKFSETFKFWSPSHIPVTFAKTFPVPSGTSRSITVFMTARQPSISLARWIQSNTPSPMFLRFLLSLSSHVCIVPSSCHFLSGFQT
jgi:hypothetical protein